MASRAVSSAKPSSALHHDVDLIVGPREVFGFADRTHRNLAPVDHQHLVTDRDILAEGAERAVAPQQTGDGLSVGDVIDGHNLKIVALRGERRKALPTRPSPLIPTRVLIRFSHSASSCRAWASVLVQGAHGRRAGQGSKVLSDDHRASACGQLFGDINQPRPSR